MRTQVTSLFGCFAIVGALSPMAFCGERPEAVRLTGRLGETFRRVLVNHVEKTDPVYLATPFRDRTETYQWQTEFWGKYMLSAVPLGGYSTDGTLDKRIAAGVSSLLATQDADGYLGNYAPDFRFAPGTWDVWGVKYTLSGLLLQYDATKDEKILTACRHLCDCLIARVGPGSATPISQTGCHSGLASCSVLEPVVGLYGRTRDPRYLEFADFIVREMTEREDGPRLRDMAEKGVPVWRRSRIPKGARTLADGQRTNRLKAYEMMSCCQGLLEYDRAKVRSDHLEAVVRTAEDIIRNELFITGSGAAYEHWFNGAVRQVRPYPHMQETCVTVTWMRLCEKLLEVTGEARWADEFERTFQNAYLAALSPDGGSFAAYTPLTGARSGGRRHCHMRANCCDANGPRGFVSYLQSMLSARRDGTVRLNWYSSALTEDFEIDTTYPCSGRVHVRYRGAPRRFRLEPRMPAWCREVKVSLNEVDLDVAASDGWIGIERDWKPGDVLTLDFRMDVVLHRLDDSVAFTRGPLVLVRDTRFRDGDLSVPLRRDVYTADLAASFRRTMSPDPSIRVAFAADLPFGDHNNREEGSQPQSVRFCDYASGAGLWRPDNVCRTWFDVQGDVVEALK